jgi:hypothetical protein
MTLVRAAALLLAALPAGPAGLLAQESGPVAAALAPWVQGASLVRVRAQGAITTGRLLAAGGDVARVETGTGTVAIPLALVDRLWVRRRSARTGALIGAAVGAVAGAVIGATGFTEGVSCDGTAECPVGKRVRNGALGALIIGVPGAALGAGIGALIPRWHQVYPASTAGR